MIGISGRCWRTIRMVSNPSIPGMKMSRNSRSKSPVSKSPGLAAVAGGDHAVAGALQQQADGHLDRHIVIHDQDSFAKSNLPLEARSTLVRRKMVAVNPLPLHASIPFGGLRAMLLKKRWPARPSFAR